MSDTQKFVLPPRRPYILGLDIGANSVGWVCLAAEPDGTGWEPTGLLHLPSEMHRWPTLGVRIFPEGVANYDQGEKEEGPGVERRRARMMRRQTERRARRMRKTFLLLQRSGLLPAYPPGTLEKHGAPSGAMPEKGPEQRRFRQQRRVAEQAARDELLKGFDQQLSRRWAARLPAERRAQAYDHLPYLLRSRAISERLDLHDVGRALYHLSQRRGFLSNRKDAEAVKPGAKKPAKDSDDNPEALKAQMGKLEQEMREQNHRTLGEHLLWKASERRVSLRNLKTRRYMYRQEFELIWQTQAAHHPEVLTDDLRAKIYAAIFRQRNLKSQADKIGICSLEDGSTLRLVAHAELVPTRPERRALACSLLFQRFRSLQRINDVRVRVKATGESRGVSAEERALLLKHLEGVKSLSAKEVPKVLGWPKGVEAQLNFDDEAGSALLGSWTNQQFHEVFGAKWEALSFDERETIVADLFNFEPDDWYEDDPDAPDRDQRSREPAIVRRALSGEGPWALLKPTRHEALELLDIHLSADYASLSRVALKRLMPLMEEGLAFRTAVEKLYKPKDSDALDYLPPVNKVFKSVNNPVVTRSLTELRRVMEHLLKYYGKPEQIRIELARDVHQGKAGRQSAQKRQRDNLKQKEGAIKKYMEETGITTVTREGTRRDDMERLRLWVEQGYTCPYTSRTISGAQVLSAEFEVDHIIPFSISQDNSYTNKVLVCARANQEKGNRIPSEAFGADPERWAKIKGWVANRRKKGGSDRKLDRMLLSKEDAAGFLADFRSRQLNDTRWASTWAKRYLMHLYGGNVGTGVDSNGRRRILVSAGSVTADIRRETGLDGILKRVIDPSTPLPNGPFLKRIDHRHHIVDAFCVAWCGPRAANALARAAEAAPEAGRRFYKKLEPAWPGFEDELVEALKACVPSHRVSARARRALHEATIYSPKSVTSGERKMNLRLGSAHRERNMEHSGNHHMAVSLRDAGDKQVVDIEVVTNWEAAQRVQAARRGRGGRTKGGPGPFVRKPGMLFTLAIGDTVELPDKSGEGRQLLFVRQLRQSTEIVFSPIRETRTPSSPPKDLEKRDAFLERCIPMAGLIIGAKQVVGRGCRKLSVSPIGVARLARA